MRVTRYATATALLAALGTPVASADPIDDIVQQQVAYVISEMSISWTALGGYVINPPTGPYNWNCNQTNLNSKFTYSCTPGIFLPTTVWKCPQVAVEANVAGPAGVTGVTKLTGTSKCSTAVSTCSAQVPLAGGVDDCAGPWAPNSGNIPFVCEANYAQATAATAWTVACRTWGIIPQ